MDGHLFRCRHCRKLRRKRTDQQRYCGSADCQKARKNAWRRDKYSTDPDYRANQRESTRAWIESQGGSGAYYRRYRNRREERAPRHDEVGDCVGPLDPTDVSANSDAETSKSYVPSGRYRLSPIDGANSDAIFVDLLVIAGG